MITSLYWFTQKSKFNTKNNNPVKIYSTFYFKEVLKTVHFAELGGQILFIELKSSVKGFLNNNNSNRWHNNPIASGS